jgi:hypothetical protein
MQAEKKEPLYCFAQRALIKSKPGVNNQVQQQSREGQRVKEHPCS